MTVQNRGMAMEAREIEAQGGGETHECPDCGATFPTEQEMQEHRESVHGQGGLGEG